MFSSLDRTMRHLVLAALILIVAAVPARAGLDEGLAAWDRGDFETALNEFRLKTFRL